jgi:hypothetical protein
VIVGCLTFGVSIAAVAVCFVFSLAIALAFTIVTAFPVIFSYFFSLTLVHSLRCFGISEAPPGLERELTPLSSFTEIT